MYVNGLILNLFNCLTCSVTKMFNYQKHLFLLGFLGTSCEEKIDPCASSPCQNNGTCYADRLVYSCSCSSGFTGPTCAQLIDFCALNPCAHGICRSVGTSYKCLCSPGLYQTCQELSKGPPVASLEATLCELYKDPCININCQNGGTCDSEGLNATCICAPGYFISILSISPCFNPKCHHPAWCWEHSAACYLQWKSGHMAESLTNMPRHSLYIIIGALCVAFVLMLIILIVGICRISRIEYQGSSRPAYEEFYNCRSIDSEFSNAIASIRHARFGKKSRPAMYDATPIAYEDYSPDDKPLVTLIKTKDL
uniref:Delta/notch like EGF repeat containing n=1 Tax=Pavo cristatus TaxID=9049 RepID=A0A8C9FYR0_PAVCR